jgi:DNA segregation ATPase FtsK/SpoIIIE-like protein
VIRIREVDMKIYLGDRNKEPVYIELGDLRNVLISGGPGGGKTVYFSRLIKELTSKYSPNEIKFVIYDGKSVDYFKFKDSPYLLFQITNDDKIEEFKSQLNELKNRQDTTPVIVLIDEFELISYKFKDCVKDIIELIKSSNEKKIYFFISSQSPSSFSKELKLVISNRICYWMINEKESKSFIGVTDGSNLKLGGEVIALIDGKTNKLQQTLFDGKLYL